MHVSAGQRRKPPLIRPPRPYLCDVPAFVSADRGGHVIGRPIPGQDGGGYRRGKGRDTQDSGLRGMLVVADRNHPELVRSVGGEPGDTVVGDIPRDRAGRLAVLQDLVPVGRGAGRGAGPAERHRADGGGVDGQPGGPQNLGDFHGAATTRPTAPSTATAATTETTRLRRRRFPAAVPAAPAGWPAGQPGPVEAGPAPAETGSVAESPFAPAAGSGRTTWAACGSAELGEAGWWCSAAEVIVSGQKASCADGPGAAAGGSRAAGEAVGIWGWAPGATVGLAAWPVAAGRGILTSDRTDAGSQSVKSAADG